MAHSPYAFCANNPVVNIDPDGQDWFRNDQGRAMWTESQESSFTDVEGVTWNNSGPSYLHQSRNGSAKYFYQVTSADGSIRLAAHFFTMDEMAIFRLFHSESAMMAAIEDHINPSFKSFLKMMAKEMAAQWTDPYLLAGGASVGVSAMGAMKPNAHFGQNSNQVYHTFRHIDNLSISRSAVQNAVSSDLSKIASTIQVGQAINRVVTVNGQQLQYTVYKLNNGELNIGRIHAK